MKRWKKMKAILKALKGTCWRIRLTRSPHLTTLLPPWMVGKSQEVQVVCVWGGDCSVPVCSLFFSVFLFSLCPLGSWAEVTTLLEKHLHFSFRIPCSRNLPHGGFWPFKPFFVIFFSLPRVLSVYLLYTPKNFFLFFKHLLCICIWVLTNS